ncbi:MAG: DUF2218 domain-containing protein [Actinomycetota bacterium]|nr:DUF2218 domain-containing protein [Actinomycetota bacterium]
MRSSAVVGTPEAEAIVMRMAKHFGHKVPVEREGGVARIALPAGRLELEANRGELVVRAEAADEAGLGRVEEIAGSHLVRFARKGRLELSWARPTLEERARAFVAPHRNARHLERTRDWLLELRPDASEALRLAALLHDADRELGGVPVAEQVANWDDEEALRTHAERSAAIATRWLRAQGADAALVQAVGDLVRQHETGGTTDADLLQAADSLSFLDVNPAARWVREGRAPVRDAERKLWRMHDRIRLPDARERAASLLERAVVELAGAELVSAGRTVQDSALA